MNSTFLTGYMLRVQKSFYDYPSVGFVYSSTITSKEAIIAYTTLSKDWVKGLDKRIKKIPVGWEGD